MINKHATFSLIAISLCFVIGACSLQGPDALAGEWVTPCGTGGTYTLSLQDYDAIGATNTWLLTSDTPDCALPSKYSGVWTATGSTIEFDRNNTGPGSAYKWKVNISGDVLTLEYIGPTNILPATVWTRVK